MKRYVNNFTNLHLLQSVEAMAVINPKLCKQLTIQVEIEQRDEGPIPHVHVYHDKTRNPKKCSYVRLDSAAYSVHHKDNMVLPDKLKAEFVKVMTSPWPKHLVHTSNGDRHLTGYEAAVDTWVDTFEDAGDYSKFQLDENGKLIPPDYTQL